MSAIELFGDACLLAGAAFFLAGTVGLLRFPDLYTRLHALAKADNLGLGFTVLGLMTRADSLAAVLKLGLVWLLALAAASSISFLVAQRAGLHGVKPWLSEDGPA